MSPLDAHYESTFPTSEKYKVVLDTDAGRRAAEELGLMGEVGIGLPEERAREICNRINEKARTY